MSGWLGAAFQVLNNQRAGRARGQLEGEQAGYERMKDQRAYQRQLQQDGHQAAQDALRDQLLKLQIADAARPPAAAEWHPTTREEAEDYYRTTHPATTTENIDPLSETGIAAALRRKRGETRIEHQYDESQTFDPNDPKSHQKFLAAYLARTRAGRRDPMTLEWVEADPTADRLAAAEDEWRGITGLTGAEAPPPNHPGAGMYDPSQDMGAFGVLGDLSPVGGAGPVRSALGPFSAAMAARRGATEATAATEPGARVRLTQPEETRGPRGIPGNSSPAPSGVRIEAPTSGKRVVSQDQADYLRAIGKWSDTLYEVGR